MSQTDENLAASIGAVFETTKPTKIGIAVSGGGDSIALMHLMARWARASKVDLFAVTVDHGLRKEAPAEALFVAGIAHDLGVAHTTLKWNNWDGHGNLQDRARQARYALIADWAKSRDIDHVALGHTIDDVAETFVMRLSRESGVDGLAAMKSRRLLGGITFVRPMLEIKRAQLREFLDRNHFDWIDDPSNEDERFERVRVRRALDLFEELGIGREKLAGVAKNLASARAALTWHTFLIAKNVVRIDAGDIVIDRRIFRTVHDEIGRQLILHALKWVSSTPYGPRRNAMSRLLEALKTGHSKTLHGCQISIDEKNIRIFREFTAINGHVVEFGEVWDRRWKIMGPNVEGATIRALGRDGLQQCPEWRGENRPADALIATPSLWHGNQLISAPFAGMAGDWAIEMAESEEDFFSSLAGH